MLTTLSRANAILNFNEDLQKKEEGAGVPINFAGVAIGNGCVNNTVQNTDATSFPRMPTHARRPPPMLV
jgi:hypothetical protein